MSAINATGHQQDISNNKLLSVLIFLSALYLAGLSSAPLWYDEAGTAWMAELPIGRLITATSGDTHPPLYLLLVAGVQRAAGSQPWALRLPSVVFALVCFYLVFKLSNELKLSNTAQALALILVMLSPFQLHYAQEARMYSLFQVEILAALLFALRRQWLWLSLALVAALYTHNYALIYLPVLACVSLAIELRRELPGFLEEWRLDHASSHDYGLSYFVWITNPIIAFICLVGELASGVLSHILKRCELDHICLAYGLPLVAWLPWVAVLSQQMASVSGGYWIQPVTFGSVIDVLQNLIFFAFTLPDWMLPTSALVASGLLVWLFIKTLQHRERPALILWWVALAPLGLTIIASLAWRPLLLFRGLAPSVPLLLILVAWELDRLSRARRLYALTIILPLMLASLVGHYLWNPSHKENTQAYVSAIRTQWREGDVMIHANEGTLMELHNQLPDLPQYILPRCSQNNLGGLSAVTRQAMGMVEAEPKRLAWSRAWFVWSWPPTVTQCEVDHARAFLESYHYRLAYAIRNDEYVSANIWLVERR